MRNRKIFGKREQMTSDLSRTRDCTPSKRIVFLSEWNDSFIHTHAQERDRVELRDFKTGVFQSHLEASPLPDRTVHAPFIRPNIRQAIYPAASGQRCR
ncbi:hypothetical protein CEXT_510001 [Caerostris extrusa]|uniref:Uncharacterized protein n=1 Tax=Caerostris extrusa TaxID=172846 RepID=A0AAV4S0V9_CAEEX|nr:hypothetical protein CEXT_510001 [Caerostris extrusa]